MYAVIFTSTLSADSRGLRRDPRSGCSNCARGQPGFISADSVRGADGRGMTVCMWESLEAIDAWRAPRGARRRPSARASSAWYTDYDLTVCEVLGVR